MKESVAVGRLKAALVFALILGYAYYSSRQPKDAQAIKAEREETYRLIHAIGNDEHESARGLSKAECETRKKYLKQSATALGTYNEATGFGSITCLPESVFTN